MVGYPLNKVAISLHFISSRTKGCYFDFTFSVPRYDIEIPANFKPRQTPEFVHFRRKMKFFDLFV